MQEAFSKPAAKRDEDQEWRREAAHTCRSLRSDRRRRKVAGSREDGGAPLGRMGHGQCGEVRIRVWGEI